MNRNSTLHEPFTHTMKTQYCCNKAYLYCINTMYSLKLAIKAFDTAIVNAVNGK